LSFGESGGHWAAVGFEAGPGPDEVGQFILFADGVEIGRYVDVGVPAVSRDGHVAYLARTVDERAALFVDGVQRRTFAAAAAPCALAAVRNLKGPQLAQHHVVRYFADGSLLLLTRDADGWAVFHDDARVASYPTSNIDPDDDACKATARLAQGSIRKADEAPVAAWFERLPGAEERWRVVRNGEPVDDAICAAPWRQQPPELSPDGTHITYACASKIGDENDQVVIIKDGVRYGPYREVWGLALSKNGAHVAYGAAPDPKIDRPWSVYVDGEPRTKRYTSVWRPLVSDDGTTLAWEAQNSDQPRGVLGIDARSVGSFDVVAWGPEFDADDRVSWIIRRGRKVTRVTVPISAARNER
jgi:hypothetical protein